MVVQVGACAGLDSTTSTSLSNWFEICWITASLPVVTSVRRETAGSSVGATLSDSML